MRLIYIEKKHGTENIAVNPDQICTISTDGGVVVLRMSCGTTHATKFTNIEHAVDYIQRANHLTC